jgi:hypothetical protein
MMSRTPEVMYVNEIIALRPIESNSGPSRSGPKKLLTAKGIRNSPATFASTL